VSDNTYVPQSQYNFDTLDTASIPAIDLAALTGLTSFSPLTTADITSLNNMNYTSGLHSYGNVTINSSSATTNPHASPYVYTTNNTGANGAYLYSNSTAPTWTTSNPGLHVQGDANFESDIKWKGRSLGKLLEKIEDRLAILQEPDPERLEKFAALKKAYDHYKTLERLIGDE
jgi:hypothetical protein